MILAFAWLSLQELDESVGDFIHFLSYVFLGLNECMFLLLALLDNLAL